MAEGCPADDLFSGEGGVTTLILDGDLWAYRMAAATEKSTDFGDGQFVLTARRACLLNPHSHLMNLLFPIW